MKRNINMKMYVCIIQLLSIETLIKINVHILFIHNIVFAIEILT